MTKVAPGVYEQKQLGCRSWVIRWSHGARFEQARRLVAPARGRTLLDYGCGDGAFLARVVDLFPDAVGVDLSWAHVRDNRERFAAAHPGTRFFHTSETAGPEHTGAYGVVTCMETLEHCVPATVDAVLRDLVRLAAPDGRIVISVPIEVGPTFLGKWAVRTLAALRGLGDYRYYERYPARDALRMLFAGPTTRIDRPQYESPDGPSHSHYGFNWRLLRSALEHYLTIERTAYTPLGFLRGLASSQVWFVCRPRSQSGITPATPAALPPSAAARP